MEIHSALEPLSSPVDWCESNFAFHPRIAEYVNTISNFLFVLLSPILVRLFSQYARAINRGIYVIWLLWTIVGLSSAYFHATLSFLGQLLDELAILWLLAASFGMWVPRRLYPGWLNKDRTLFQRIMFTASVCFTVLAWVYPLVNAFFLMALGLPCFILLYLELKKCRNARVKRLGIRCTISWLFSVGFWISDRLFCDLWLRLNFPYLHGAWHVSIAITSCTLCVLFAYFDAYNEHYDLMPLLRYWPSDNVEFGVPYIFLKNAD